MAATANAPQVFNGVGYIALGDAVVILWKGPATLQTVKWAFDRVDGALTDRDLGVIVLQLILPSSTPPDSAARGENHRRLQSLGPALRRLVSVPLGDALWVNVVRTVMRGMAIVTGQSKTHLVGHSERSGLDYLLGASGPRTPPRAEIEAAIIELYRTVGVPRV